MRLTLKEIILYMAGIVLIYDKNKKFIAVRNMDDGTAAFYGDYTEVSK